MTAMTDSPKTLVFAGSTRDASFNRRLAAAAARRLEAVGGASTLLELSDYPLPMYNGDLEARDGLPGPALELREIFMAHQGLLIAAPEYNSSIPPLLKNVIDWISRAPEGEPGLAPYQGKCAALVSASPGGFGGMRGLAALRSILGSIGVMVLPNQFALARAHAAFEADGSLAEKNQQARLDGVVSALHSTLTRLHR
jgi:chromate reductase